MWYASDRSWQVFVGVAEVNPHCTYGLLGGTDLPSTVGGWSPVDSMVFVVSTVVSPPGVVTVSVVVLDASRSQPANTANATANTPANLLERFMLVLLFLILFGPPAIVQVGFASNSGPDSSSRHLIV